MWFRKAIEMIVKEEEIIQRTTAFSKTICCRVMFVTYLEDLAEVDAIFLHILYASDNCKQC